MCAHVFVNECVWMCTCVCVHAHMYVYECVSVFACEWVFLCVHTHTCVCEYVCGMSTYVMHVCTFVGGNAHLAHSQPHSVEIQSHLIWSFDGDQLAPAVLLSRSLSLIAVGLQLGAVTPGCLYRCWRFKLIFIGLHSKGCVVVWISMAFIDSCVWMLGP